MTTRKRFDDKEEPTPLEQAAPHLTRPGYRRVKASDFWEDDRHTGFVYVKLDTDGPLVFEGTPEPKYEDSRAALILAVGGADYGISPGGVFVRVQSWDETTRHPELQRFIGKKIRVTVEVV
jgi:hypothetical protein